MICNGKVNFDHFCYRYFSACMFQNASFIFINTKSCSKIWLCLRNQFHKGTIRTLDVQYSLSLDNIFQFHKGTIRTLLQNIYLWDWTNFNSIKVRLEPGTTTAANSFRRRFQFHKGTIRTETFSRVSGTYFHFNSIKLRLEHASQQGLVCSRKFQFHKGTIRTSVLGLYHFLLWIFQFHKGTIRTLSLPPCRMLWLISIP